MSRQIISYADLGPVKTTKAPTVSLESPNRRSSPVDEPPRKRLRTDHGDVNVEPILQVHDSSSSQRHSPTRVNGNNVNGLQEGGSGNGRRKNKKPRNGNPSGVPWTQHWDAQHGSSWQRDSDALTYAEDTEVDANLGADEVVHAERTEAVKSGNINGHIQEMVVTSIQTASTSKATIPTAGTPDAVKKAARRKQKEARNTGSEAKKGETVALAEEEWDDSALIDAWNAAEDHYREMNGGKKWRLQPVKHSFLWHSTADIEQITDSEGDSQGSEDQKEDAPYYEEEGDPQELEDPSSTIPVPPETWPFAPLPVLPPRSASTAMEEAFHKAKDASYALGYWTAVYQMHAQQQKQQQQRGDTVVDEMEENEVPADEEFVPTQR